LIGPEWAAIYLNRPARQHQSGQLSIGRDQLKPGAADYFGVVALNAALAADLDYQVAYAIHYNSQQFHRDPIGDLIYQSEASSVFNSDLSNSLQGNLSWQPLVSLALPFGFYVGEYAVEVDEGSLVFPVDSQGHQLQTTSIMVGTNMNRINALGGLDVEDTWHITDKLGVNIGTRWDIVSGFTNGNQVSPTINLFYQWRGTTLHSGFARYFQFPISRRCRRTCLKLLRGQPAPLASVEIPSQFLRVTTIGTRLCSPPYSKPEIRAGQLLPARPQLPRRRAVRLRADRVAL
jgi:outer membrane receptor protein involved in Fe transport